MSLTSNQRIDCPTALKSKGKYVMHVSKLISVFLTKNKTRRSIHRKIVKFSSPFLTQQTFQFRRFSTQGSAVQSDRNK